jgi:N-acetylneuraminate synthase
MNEKPYLIAELSANHNNDVERALKIINAAKDSGADAIKFQTYTADKITLNCDKSDFVISDGIWKDRILFELYSEGSLPWEWHERLFLHAKSLGLDVISTPFDHSAVDFLETLNVDAYKIASFELVDIPLIQRVAQTQKHVFLSTGMAKVSEITEAVEAIGHDNVTLFHCISSYPAKVEQSNLPFLLDLKREFNLQVGLSDHCLTNNVAGAAVALGAKVIEKHFTIDRDGGGLDDSFSQTPQSFNELRKIVDEVYFATQKQEERSDLPSKKYRKSIYASQKIIAGEKFTKDNIRVVRPGYGLAPKFFDALINKKSKYDYDFGDRIIQDELL